MSPRPLFADYADQTAIDQAYNPDVVALNRAQSMEHMAAQAHQARSTLPNHPKVPFGATLEEYLNIFPAAQPNAPVLVYLHGGYWRANRAENFDGVALGGVAAGFTTVVLNYALCPFVTLDEIVRQVRAGLVWVHRHIERYHGNPQQVVVAGHSAGGQLTAMALLTPWQRDYGLDDNWLAGGLMVSGLFELAPLRYSYLQPLIQLNSELIERNSPARLVQPRTVPAYFCWGGLEQSAFAQQSSLMHERWRAAGNTSELQQIPDCDHFSILRGFDSADGTLIRAARSLLAAKNSS